MLCVRTTVTLDPETERLIRDAMRQSGRGFKEILNGAVQMALRPQKSVVVVEPIFPAPFPLEAETDTRPRALGDQWEDDGTLSEVLL